ncbi:MAG: hypothetical protein LBN02_03740, partial [Oscillospiraceae bacterium]|nr:hypothetical protein [Oscillospiraceae bacterium]
MDKSIITQRRKKYKHILRDDRITIEKLLRARVEHTEITRIIGCSARTLTREIERGLCEQLESDLTRKLVYFADY